MRKNLYLKMLLSVALAICILACMTSCGNAPTLDEVGERFKSLIEASYELNDIFWGDGLPTYERGGEFDREHMLYSGESGEYEAFCRRIWFSCRLGFAECRKNCP